MISGRFAYTLYSFIIYSFGWVRACVCVCVLDWMCCSVLWHWRLTVERKTLAFLVVVGFFSYLDAVGMHSTNDDGDDDKHSGIRYGRLVLSMHISPHPINQRLVFCLSSLLFCCFVLFSFVFYLLLLVLLGVSSSICAPNEREKKKKKKMKTIFFSVSWDWHS